MLYSAWVDLSSNQMIGVTLRKAGEYYDLYVEMPIVHGYGSGLLINDGEEESDDLGEQVRQQLSQISQRCEALAAELLNHAVEFSRLAEGKIDLAGCESPGKPKRPNADSEDDLLADLLDELE
jgi:hypothetical protein